jgi:copper chaperone CopZ
MDGVTDYKLDIPNSLVHVTFDDTETSVESVIGGIEKSGFKVEGQTDSAGAETLK